MKRGQRGSKWSKRNSRTSRSRDRIEVNRIEIEEHLNNRITGKYCKDPKSSSSHREIMVAREAVEAEVELSFKEAPIAINSSNNQGKNTKGVDKITIIVGAEKPRKAPEVVIEVVMRPAVATEVVLIIEAEVVAVKIAAVEAEEEKNAVEVVVEGHTETITKGMIMKKTTITHRATLCKVKPLKIITRMSEVSLSRNNLNSSNNSTNHVLLHSNTKQNNSNHKLHLNHSNIMRMREIMKVKETQGTVEDEE